MAEISFEHYFEKVFKRGTDCPLFHEWVFDQMFSMEPLPPQLADKMKLALYRTLSTAFWTGNVTKVVYGHELASRVKIPVGWPKAGTKISDLIGTPDVWKLLINLKKITRDENVRQGCTAKLNEMTMNKNMAQEEADKKAKNRKK